MHPSNDNLFNMTKYPFVLGLPIDSTDVIMDASTHGSSSSAIITVTGNRNIYALQKKCTAYVYKKLIGTENHTVTLLSPSCHVGRSNWYQAAHI